MSRTRRTLAWVAALALLGVGVAAAVRVKPADRDDTARLTRSLLRPLTGVPQDAFTLGRADAPERMAVYANVTSGGFAAFEQNVLPALVSRYVRPGRLAIQLRTWPAQPESGGNDVAGSSLAARGAHAAGLQGRLWQYLAVMSARYPGYFDRAVLAEVFDHTPGLNADEALQAIKDPRVVAEISSAVRRGKRVGFSEPPGYVFDPAGDATPVVIHPAGITAKAFIAALDRARR